MIQDLHNDSYDSQEEKPQMTIEKVHSVVRKGKALRHTTGEIALVEPALNLRKMNYSAVEHQQSSQNLVVT